MDHLPFPPISAELIKALEERFPDKAADLKWTDREVWHKSGQVSVVRFLRAEFISQTEPEETFDDVQA